MACLLHCPLSNLLPNTTPPGKTRSKGACGTGVCDAVLLCSIDELSIVTRRKSETFAGPCPQSNSRRGAISPSSNYEHSNVYYSSRLRPSCSAEIFQSSSTESLSCLRVQHTSGDRSPCTVYGLLHLSGSEKNFKSRQRSNHRSTGIYPFLYRPIPASTRTVSVKAILEASGFGDNLRSYPYDPRSVGQSAHCAFGKAFSSMVFIVRSLQSYAIHMRSILLCEKDIHQLLSTVHKEMHSSFVWLFQQIFARTPVLMISVMLLFSDFTVHSLGQNIVPVQVALFDQFSPLINYYSSHTSYSTHHFFPLSSQGHVSYRDSDFFTLSVGGNGIGGNGPRKSLHSDSYDEDSFSWDLRQRELFHSKDWNALVKPPASATPSRVSSFKESADAISKPEGSRDESGLRSLLERTAREMELKEGQPLTHLQLDQETIRLLVAPIRVQMESDNYACFDRTDLQYQHAITAEPENPMLLANYAQFLYVVRRDMDSAEEMFHRAMTADPTDGDVLARFASFLWLGRGDKTAAERAYRAAIASDPCNPYYSGSYAHFLWHAGDEDISCPIP